MLKGRFILQLAVLSAGFAAFAGINGDGDNLLDTGYAGAVANSDRSEDLYRKSHDDEHEYRHTHDDHFLSKALGEARQAFAAEAQARELARAALAGNATSNASSLTPVQNPSEILALQNLANGQSPLSQEMQNVFTGYGFNIGDTSNLSGDFASPAHANSAAPASPASGPNSAASNPGAAGTASSVSVSGSTSPGGLPVQGTALNAAKSVNRSTASTTPNGSPSVGSVGTLSGSGSGRAKADRKEMLENNRAWFLKKLGVAGSPAAEEAAGMNDWQDPILSKNVDIFQVVHSHYDSLKSEGSFFGDHLPPSSEPSSASFSESVKKLEANRSAVIKQIPARRPSMFQN